jgi:NAD(P)-dependent dehydrogenase (short-subunit alcohol dehydrogenase family)
MNPDHRLLSNFHEPVNVLVAGASGGIGLALIEQLLSNAQVSKIFAVSRQARCNPSLAALTETHAQRLTLLNCDITDEAALADLACTTAKTVDGLHLIINTVGMLHDGSIQPEKSLSQISLSALQTSFAVNAFAPILLAKALLPLLRHRAPAVFVSLSARVGSISDNRVGGWYSYRAAKAAQNQLLKTLSIELTRINRQSIVMAYHPGTTDTQLSKPFQAHVEPSKLFSTEFAADALLKVIAQRMPSDSGGFYAWDGQQVDW